MLSHCQASHNIALTTSDDALEKLRCICVTTAENIIGQSSASCGKFFLALLETLENAVCTHWHAHWHTHCSAAAQFFNFFAARQRNRSSVFFRIVLRLSNIVADG
jgi:hypothetical protein